jgi:oligosaccharide repeat unit polymerase
LRTILNPALIYASTWLSVLIIYWLGLSHLLESLETLTIILVVGTSFAFILGWILESSSKQWRLSRMKLNISAMSEIIGSARVGRRLKTIWISLGIGVFLEVAYFQGAPGLGLIGVGPDISYTDYGIPGLHGLLNSFFYTCCVVQFSRILLGISTRTSLLTFISIGYPVLGMSRQVLMSLLLQYLLIYFSIKKTTAKDFVRTGLLFVVALLIFGYLGDIRSGREHIISLAQPTFEYPEWLPSAFIWLYIYLCTPLNNVNYNINIAPNYFPLETASSLIPSIAREHIMAFVGWGSQQWNLVTESFNVSSLLQSFLTDFGVSGTIFFTLLCGIVFSRFLRRSNNSPAAFFTVIVFMHGVALSFFANLLFHLVFIFEIFIISWILVRRRN